MSDLFAISQLAKTDTAAAEKQLFTFVKKSFPELALKSIHIKKSEVSLNSVHGFLHTFDHEYFFKFHTEENETKTLGKNEYYQSKELTAAGLPLINPLWQKTEPGNQFLIYEKIEAPTAFELFRELEIRYFPNQQYDLALKEKLLQAESHLLETQWRVAKAHLQWQERTAVKDSILHQLFFWRLVSPNNTLPRSTLFYENAVIDLAQKSISFAELKKKKWIINGIEYTESLEEVIQKAMQLLDPEKEEETAMTLGHGDDHNGNKFFIQDQFFLFDPAFAGLQPTLLSFVKATIHNTFLHPFWLYEPEKLEQHLELSYAITADSIQISHNWDLAEVSPIRLDILNLYKEKIWKPLLKELTQKNMLPAYWKEYLRAAFFCCPFLVYNLTDSNKYSPVASLLALSKCIELGSKSIQTNSVDTFLRDISAS